MKAWNVVSTATYAWPNETGVATTRPYLSSNIHGTWRWKVIFQDDWCLRFLTPRITKVTLHVHKLPWLWEDWYGTNHCIIGAVLPIQAAPRSSPLDMVVGSRVSNHGKAIVTNLTTTVTRQLHIVTQTWWCHPRLSKSWFMDSWFFFQVGHAESLLTWTCLQAARFVQILLCPLLTISFRKSAPRCSMYGLSTYNNPCMTPLGYSDSLYQYNK